MSDFFQPYIDLEHRKDEIARILAHVPICGFSGPQNDGDREPHYSRGDLINALARYEFIFRGP